MNYASNWTQLLWVFLTLGAAAAGWCSGVWLVAIVRGRVDAARSAPAK